LIGGRAYSVFLGVVTVFYFAAAEMVSHLHIQQALHTGITKQNQDLLFAVVADISTDALHKFIR
jgi:hypothetical protein